MLFSLPELTPRYVAPATGLFKSAPSEPANDLLAQLAKLGVALVQGRTGAPLPLAPAGGGAAMETDGLTPAATADASAAVTAAAVGGNAAAAGGGRGGAVAESVRPLAFKTLVGRGHHEFSSARQQVSEVGVLLVLNGRAAFVCTC